MHEYIYVKGARENNLKGIDVKIPRDKMVVLTGLSGSGKSSLAFDTIYADKQRLYEIIAEGKSRLQSQMTGSAHTVSAIRAMSYFSRVAAINEVMNGITLYRFYDEFQLILTKSQGSKFEHCVDKFVEITD